jgi:putative transposase
MPEPPKLAINAVIRSSIPDHPLSEPHRVLYIDEDDDRVVLFHMGKLQRRPKRFALQKLSTDLATGSIKHVTIPLPPVMLLSESVIPPRYKTVRDKWWAKFEPLLGQQHLALLFDDFGGAIKSFSDTAGIWRQTVYVYVYRFFYYGCVPNAFLPRFDLRGGAGKSRILGVRKAGRPRKAVALGHNEDLGINISDDDTANFLVALRRYWAIGEHATFRHAYNKLCEEFYADITEERDGGFVTVRMLERPSYRQFIYHAKQLPEFPELFKRRVTAKRFSRKYRAITGVSGAEVQGPMQRYHIDATVADTYLVSMFNRGWIIGRPVVYIVTDVFTSKNVGLYCGLEGPSWEGARLALLNAFLPKDEYLRRYGLENELVWVVDGVPDSVMADRAELLSENALGLPTGLNVTIDIAPGYRPDLKGTVERKFGKFNEVVHFMPGAVLKRNRERGERHYARDATLNMWEFTREIVRMAVHENEHKQLGARLTRQMLNVGVDPTPNGLFSFGMEHLIGGTPHRTREEIYAHLLPQGSASVRPEGIFFEGLSYTSPLSIEERWFERARIHKHFSVPIRYNPEIPSRIWVVSNPESELRSCVHEATLIDHYNRYENVQLDEARDLRDFQQLCSKDAETGSLEGLIRNAVLNGRDLAQAQKELRDTVMADSPSKRVKNIRSRRGVEKQGCRGTQAQFEAENFGRKPKPTESPTSADSPALPPSPTTSVEASILTMLQSEGQNK